jgi:hypothetical protein
VSLPASLAEDVDDVPAVLEMPPVLDMPPVVVGSPVILALPVEVAGELPLDPCAEVEVVEVVEPSESGSVVNPGGFACLGAQPVSVARAMKEDSRRILARLA